jgi:hypothetical protein
MNVKEYYKKWYFKTQGIECGEPLSNELVIIKFAEEFAAEQNKELKENAMIAAMIADDKIKELMKDCSSYATNIDLLIGDLEGAQDKIKELTEYAHHHQSCDSVGVYGKLDIECNCGFKQVMK